MIHSITLLRIGLANAIRRSAVAGAFATLAALTACGGEERSNLGPTSGLTITTLSNRADLISGGSALVELKTPGFELPATLKVDRDGTDITAAFGRDANGRILGLITGLKNGANTISATTTDGSWVGARLVITNHPIGGPVLLASQATPWVCATPVPVAAVGNSPGSNASGLSTVATDAQCNIATEFKLWYRTQTPVTAAAGDGGCSFVLPDPTPTIAIPTPTTPANSCFQPYVTGSTPAASVASTTTSAGVTVPYIVRVERGTLNRGIYDIAVLFDPTKPAWTARTPQPQWNGKLLYTFGAGSNHPRTQFRSQQNWAIAFLPGFWDDSALRLGYMVADHSLTDSGYNTNRVLTAETTMMMKEHIVDNYGEIKYAMGNGGSGGALNQNINASIYPGLLDGIQPSVNFVDTTSSGTEIVDCLLLVNFYVKPQWTALMGGLTQAQINAKKAAINGHRDQLGCHGINNSLANYYYQPGNFTPTLVADANGTLGAGAGGPRNNCSLPAALVYDRVTNPTGTRCGDPDLSVGVWGTTAGLAGGTSLRALSVVDNVGVQYGLKALLSGAITPEEFVVLNERAGGIDPDSNLVATRSVADAAALPTAYRSGLITSGKNLAKVAIIDSRGFDEGPSGLLNIHFNWRSFSARARLDAEAGGHANQVIWRYGTFIEPSTPPQIAAVTTSSFTNMDIWLSNLMSTAPKASLNAVRTQAQVIAGKPGPAVDFCFLTPDVSFATKVTDQATCDADVNLKVFASPRQAAGGPLAENILKCQLKAINLADYGGVTFTQTQQTRLAAVFTSGVCDWTKAGVGQQDAVSPLTFTAGPGGVPLPAAPVSGPI